MQPRGLTADDGRLGSAATPTVDGNEREPDGPAARIEGMCRRLTSAPAN